MSSSDFALPSECLIFIFCYAYLSFLKNNLSMVNSKKAVERFKKVYSFHISCKIVKRKQIYSLTKQFLKPSRA